MYVNNRVTGNLRFSSLLTLTKSPTGPDQIVPTNEYINWVPGGHVKLRVGTRGASAEPPISVPGLLRRTTARYPDGVALATKKADGKWHKITYR